MTKITNVTINIPSVLKITQQHIDKGRKGSTKSCPIALALKAALKGQKVHNIQIDGSGADCVVQIPIKIGAKTFTKLFRLELWLPAAAHMFIAKFDNDREVKPTTFVMKATSLGAY